MLVRIMIDCKDEIADFTVSKDSGAHFALGSNMSGQTEAYRNLHLTQEPTDGERIEMAATRVLVKYKAAFEELAK